MMGPVVYLELWSGEKQHHPLVQETTSIVRFKTPLATEGCLYLLEKHKQFMMPGKALEARKLTEKEEKEYEQRRGKREAPALERNDKRRKTLYVCKKQSTTRKTTLSPPSIKKQNSKYNNGEE